MTYEGVRRVSDGAIVANRIEVVHNDLEEGEAKLWKSLKVSAKPAQGFTPGELKIEKVGKFKLLPNDDVQQYVSQLGQRLIPPYQRDLPEGTPHKIPFQFHVVHGFCCSRARDCSFLFCTQLVAEALPNTIEPPRADSRMILERPNPSWEQWWKFMEIPPQEDA